MAIPYAAEPHLLMGRVLLRSGQIKAAVDALRIAVWSQDSAAGRLALAEALLQSEDKDGARTEANKALTLDPGLVVNGTLQRFGYDTATGQVVVTYDASLSTAGGNRVETRRFTATAPADGTSASIGPALNRAANQVAFDVAKWIGSSGS